VVGFKKVLSINAEIGKMLAEKWNLPAKLAQIIASHHRFVSGYCDLNL
jgi:HD-like signal output (HDOD) protein